MRMRIATISPTTTRIIPCTSLRKLNYSDAYIKNLTKELFSKKYLIKQGKGVPGGLFSSKLIKLFNSQEFQQYL